MRDFGTCRIQVVMGGTLVPITTRILKIDKCLMLTSCAVPETYVRGGPTLTTFLCPPPPQKGKGRHNVFPLRLSVGLSVCPSQNRVRSIT